MATSTLGRGFVSVVLFGGLVACNADPGIEYADCVRPKRPYVETFEGNEQTLFDRCWHAENDEERDVKIGQDDDLIITHGEEVSWEGASPMLFQHVEGDFVLVTKTEASSGLNSNFCDMNEADASGLVVRGDGFRATWLVTPYLLDPTMEVTCEDESARPPRALVSARTSSSPEPVSPLMGIGVDGEADIAICRREDRLAYFYRYPAGPDPEAEWASDDWKQLTLDDEKTGKTDVVGLGPLDVGVTTTISRSGVALGVEGHFNWVVLLDLSDDCLGPLNELAEPEGE